MPGGKERERLSGRLEEADGLALGGGAGAILTYLRGNPLFGTFQHLTRIEQIIVVEAVRTFVPVFFLVTTLKGGGVKRAVLRRLRPNGHADEANSFSVNRAGFLRSFDSGHTGLHEKGID